MSSTQQAALVHVSTVANVVELVSKVALYFDARLGSGEEEIAEQAAHDALDAVVAMPRGAVASILLALSSIAAGLGPDAIADWAEDEVRLVEGDLPS
jgi:hypothetical protein